MARAVADGSIYWRDHRVALALEAAARAEHDAELLAALRQPADTTGIPPWSEVSEPRRCHGASPSGVSSNPAYSLSTPLILPSAGVQI